MGAVLAVLARMRVLGIYDSATIVIGGDHGAYVPPARYVPGSHALAEAERRQYSPLLIGLARPALLVKPPHASGPVRVSQAPSWVVDTPATIADAAGIPGTFPGVSLLRLDEHAPRRRIFYFYHYDKSNWTSDYLPPITEVIVDGRSDDIDAWGIGRTFMPPAAGAAR
jgi:arylsulfatase A-like enzyme